MNYATHAKWCQFLASIGELDPQHVKCVDAEECVAERASGAEEPSERGDPT